MNEDWQRDLQEWEEDIGRREKAWKELWDVNDPMGMGLLAYSRDVVPYKGIVRLLRLKAGQAICWGPDACLERNLGLCAAGKHETCKQHSNDCLLCQVRKQG